MAFNVTGDAYDRFMGRYSRVLAPQLADLAGVTAGQRVLDVGSGPGALTAELVARLGDDAVSAAEPSAKFVAALRERLPGVRAEQAAAEALPFGDGEFDAAIAQLVVHFMADPVAGLREMARVTRPGGVVAACVWDHAGERSPIAVFWRAARELDPGARDESELAGAHEGHLAELFREAGIGELEEAVLEVPFGPASFEEWWEPFTLGVGPAGEYVAALDEDARATLRERCRELLPGAPRAVAWAARGVA
ncbi:class I SAM-dependent methyltransferase [Candidatus Solirubrobacter pratensis]|uniref:class I SAM-dependent methyltransferase n=1 Tax=Candidatus Solirubrobacter pratensis TaxID=1298857 RepID=UPI00041B9C7D|nr:class I SAM-dependent methyltransferase [Candidatus Solirubrobacter pratensis]